MFVLGISAFYHDSAAVLIEDGEIIAAVQEARFTRIKHDHSFPINAIRRCLSEAGISVNDLEVIAFYDKPFLKFTRILETYLSFPFLGIQSFLKAMPLWLKQKLWIPDLIQKKLDYDGKIIFPEHHESHAASAFFPSPFNKAAFLTMDGVGEWATSSYGIGENNTVKIQSELHFPHSLGLLYSAFTYFSGFKVNSGEYKLMGLAPYGEPKYKQKIYDHLIDLKDDGSFRLNPDYFSYLTGLKMTNKRFAKLFDGPPRKPESEITQREMDIARSIQEVTEDIVLKMAAHVKKETGENKLCLAGGVALNSVANGLLHRTGLFDDIWIQPAAGDAGGALGAAYIAYHHYKNQPLISKNMDQQKGSLLGTACANDQIQRYLDQKGVVYEYYSDEELVDAVSGLLINHNVVGWFQGRMEFGPRALGNRSILADPRDPEMQKKLNLKIKFRENFRPFAPSVLMEESNNWFDLPNPSPYMLMVTPVRKEKLKENSTNDLKGLDKLKEIRSDIPAVTHVDNSARIQTVHKETNPLYHNLIKKFAEKSGCPVLINTSFNIRGEPIVESPEDAYKCFMRTNMDVLVLGNFMLLKREHSEQVKSTNEKLVYELD